MTEKPIRFRPPQVDKILQEEILKPWHEKVQRTVITQVIRNVLTAQKNLYKKDDHQERKEDLSAGRVAELASSNLEELFSSHLKSVINGTGVIINTNLGRSPLPAGAVQAVMPILQNYCDLELDLDVGKRGERLSNVESLLQIISGCEAALLVNNNAASVFLAVTALAKDKEVIISRGELVEIGGSFRLPDVIVAAGGKLKEVGTTNRTRIEDYRNALSSETAMILKCHRSNFEMTGFVEDANTTELRSLASAKNIPFVEDLGGGALVDLERFGFKKERTVQDCLKDGLDLVLFSGDKLLGGPQAGLVLGRKEYVGLLRKHPIYRALRLDKMLVALLECILIEYLRPAPEKVLPVLMMAGETAASIQKRVEIFIGRATQMYPNIAFKCVPTESAFGGGTSPGQTQKSFGLAITSPENHRLSAKSLAALLRSSSPPVIARLQDEKVILDFRTIRGSDEPSLLAALGIIVNR